jgi:hypothetical protein
MFRFTIRDVLWLMVVVGLVLTLLPEIQRRREAERMVDAFEQAKQAKMSRHIFTQADYDSLPYGRAKK